MPGTHIIEIDTAPTAMLKRIEQLEQRIVDLEKLLEEDTTHTLRWSEMAANYARQRVRDSRKKNVGVGQTA